MHIDDLAERFQIMVRFLAGTDRLDIVWVVFYQGRVFGAYPEVDQALEKVSEIEHCISVDDVPTPQV
ncbi:hypothetical protein O2604_21710 [Pseudomonas aeruginosa]|uniref:hypothetical protein n=1 Tax=Pseudomonas aeruginosa TaxID=287 RepID=UPI001D0A7B8F|nr:hypothetical protein [Pseudomonas aeruginosa]MCC0192599.1 hypothetical protein [Pseudomonas aeruginosa]MCC0226601.1 hypothetical protein [Pseudomonas aeruginosa]MCC0450680.1 hypothetical protein [Pseudomonas aeruginosa]MDI3755990.1 hypothetical protein [Pseudomonas aeruginosa]MDI3999480.1 hypothetical protein [Pseudomonas aeruginosa]